jgi:hypothetical protein
MAERPELLFDRRCRNFTAQGLNPSGDMERCNGHERTHAVFLAPSEEICNGATVGFAGVAVADLQGEELHEAPPAASPLLATSAGIFR